MSARVPLPERNQLADIRAHRIRDAHNHFEIGLAAADFSGFLHQLQIAAGIGECSGFLVSIGRRQDHVGECSGFGQEHVLHHDESSCEKANGSICKPSDRIRSDNIERFQFCRPLQLSTISGSVSPAVAELAPHSW